MYLYLSVYLLLATYLFYLLGIIQFNTINLKKCILQQPGSNRWFLKLFISFDFIGYILSLKFWKLFLYHYFQNYVNDYFVEPVFLSHSHLIFTSFPRFPAKFCQITLHFHITTQITCCSIFSSSNLK